MAPLRTLPDEVNPPKLLRMLGKPKTAVSKDDSGYTSVLQQIASLSKLKKGWDSYDGAPITKEAQRRAIAFISTLLTHVDQRLSPPIVGPSASGGVVLRWVTDSHDVMLTFLSDGGEYSVVDKATNQVIAEGKIGRPESLIRDVIRSYLLE